MHCGGNGSFTVGIEFDVTCMGLSTSRIPLMKDSTLRCTEICRNATILFDYAFRFPVHLRYQRAIQAQKEMLFSNIMIPQPLVFYLKNDIVEDRERSESTDMTNALNYPDCWKYHYSAVNSSDLNDSFNWQSSQFRVHCGFQTRFLFVNDIFDWSDRDCMLNLARSTVATANLNISLAMPVGNAVLDHVEFVSRVDSILVSGSTALVLTAMLFGNWIRKYCSL